MEIGKIFTKKPGLKQHYGYPIALSLYMYLNIYCSFISNLRSRLLCLKCNLIFFSIALLIVKQHIFTCRLAVQNRISQKKEKRKKKV